jgi:hypothetical protein
LTELLLADVLNGERADSGAGRSQHPHSGPRRQRARRGDQLPGAPQRDDRIVITDSQPGKVVSRDQPPLRQRLQRPQPT